MADLKISQLTAIATFDDADLYVIVDTSATETKKVTHGALKTALASAFGLSVAANQIVYGTGSGITSSSDFTWENSNRTLFSDGSLYITTGACGIFIDQPNALITIGDPNNDLNNCNFIVDNNLNRYIFNYPNFNINSVAYIFPSALGSSGSVLTDAAGDGTLSWVVPSSGFLLASGATTGATSQAQEFTIGIKTNTIYTLSGTQIEIITGADSIYFDAGTIQTPNGADSAPSYAFRNAPNVGFYYTDSPHKINIAIGGALAATFDATGLGVGVAGTLTGKVDFNGATSGTVTIQAAAAAGTWTLTLPTTDGNSGEFLQTNGSGVTTWAVPAGTGANTALSNLASVAINTTLLPGSNDGAALGSGTLSFSDLFLASGALINFANGNSVITHSSGVLTVSTGDLRVTTAGTSSTSVATLDGTQILTNKSIVATQLTGTAYTMAVNNTNATAAYTLATYRNDTIADYDGTFTWNSTPPSTIVSQKMAMMRIGNMVILTISVLYTSAGTTNTTCIVTLPSIAPNPAVFAASGDNASEYMYPISGARVEANQTANPSAIRGGIRRNSGDSAFEILLIFGSSNALQLQVTVIYFTA